MNNNNPQQVPPVPFTQKDLFQQFWKHYTQNFYNYNIAQFAQLSAHFKMSMPMPIKIKELGEIHLKKFFDAVWINSEKVEPSYQLMFDQLQQQPQSKPLSDEPNNPGPSNYQRNQQRANFSNQAHPYQLPKRGRGRGRPRITNPGNRFNNNNNEPRQHLTNWSDDESSERAASNFRGNNKNKFNRMAVNNLGFRGDSSDEDGNSNRN